MWLMIFLNYFFYMPLYVSGMPSPTLRMLLPLILPRLLLACVLLGPGSMKLVCCSVKASQEAELAKLKQGCNTGGALTRPVRVGNRVSTMCLEEVEIKFKIIQLKRCHSKQFFFNFHKTFETSNIQRLNWSHLLLKTWMNHKMVSQF